MTRPLEILALAALGALCLPGQARRPHTAAVAQQAAATVKPPKANVTSAQLTPAEMEHFLSTARIIAQRPITTGITHTLRLTLSDGRYTHDAHLQQIDEYKPLMKLANGTLEKNFRDSFRFNIAAYRLDKLMGLDMVPVCVYREVDGKPGALDWWVDDVMFDEEGRRKKEIPPPDLNAWSRQLNTIRDFDQLVGNEDRNQGNLLVDKSWRLWAIDHSRAFRDTNTPLDPKVLKRITVKMLAAMKALNLPSVEETLLPYVTHQDVQTLMARRDWMVHFFETQVQEKGADAVLLDMPRKTPEVTIP